MACKRVTIRKVKNKSGTHYVISEGGQRRFTKSTKAEATKSAKNFRKRKGC